VKTPDVLIAVLGIAGCTAIVFVVAHAEARYAQAQQEHRRSVIRTCTDQHTFEIGTLDTVATRKQRPTCFAA
jgi:hypothetical protein